MVPHYFRNAITSNQTTFNWTGWIIKTLLSQSPRQTRMKFPTFAAGCDRHFISDRAAADLASSLLHEFNKYYNLNIPQQSLIIDRYKGMRDREKSRKTSSNCFSDQKIWGLCFDGRRGNTLSSTHDQDTNTNHYWVIREEISKRSRLHFYWFHHCRFGGCPYNFRQHIY